MEVRLRLFAGLRQVAGFKDKTVSLPEGAVVADLLADLPQSIVGRTFYIAINEEYARRDSPLKDGDLVALLPPVSGGQSPKLFEITEAPLSQDDILRRVSRPDCGGVVTFAGTVRGTTATGEGARDTDFLDYEAYIPMAEKMMARIGDEVMERWPQVKAVSILHRIGRCEIEEPTVLIAVATPHRGDGCFEACRYAIERLKAIVPIWKKENWADGEVWVEGPRQPELVVSNQ
jgi:molybdopterin synthase catalytic subunit/molybdopterin converting factor small subunit